MISIVLTWSAIFTASAKSGWPATNVLRLSSRVCLWLTDNHHRLMLLMLRRKRRGIAVRRLMLDGCWTRIHFLIVHDFCYKKYLGWLYKIYTKLCSVDPTIHSPDRIGSSSTGTSRPIVPIPDTILGRFLFKSTRNWALKGNLEINPCFTLQYSSPLLCDSTLQ